MTRLADLCGTWRGVKAHRKIGEPCCPPCAEIKAARARDYRRERYVKGGISVLARRPDLADLKTPVTRLIAGHAENA